LHHVHEGDQVNNTFRVFYQDAAIGDRHIGWPVYCEHGFFRRLLMQADD
jgi:hypothetical protein